MVVPLMYFNCALRIQTSTSYAVIVRSTSEAARKQELNPAVGVSRGEMQLVCVYAGFASRLRTSNKERKPQSILVTVTCKFAIQVES